MTAVVLSDRAGPVLGCLLLAVAVAVWPAAGRVGRAGPPRARPGPDLRWVSAGRAASMAIGVGLLVTAGAAGGAAGLVAAGMVLGTGALLARRGLAEVRRRRALPQVLASLRMLGRELRSGADPVTAAQGAAAAGHGAGARLLNALVLHMRSGDPATIEAARSADDPVTRASTLLTGGWLLSRRHGVAFGRVVAGIADELSDQFAAAQARGAQLAGPRVSGYVMAALPLMGLLLGAGMGVSPVAVLFGSALGNLLLLIGVALTCAGLLWSARIVGR